MTWRSAAQATVHGQILPHLQTVAQALDPRLQVAALGEPADLQLTLHYPSVLLEFGGKNRTLPREQRTIRTYLAEDARIRSAVTLPEATVEVLDARRIFWEKPTALQVACAQPHKLHRLRAFSRHLLDLHVLMQGEIGPAALSDPGLRDDVLATKAVLFRESGVEYADVQNGTAVIMPAGEVRRALEEDDQQMEASGMFGQTRVPFGVILTTLEQVQLRLTRDAGGADPGQPS